MENYLPPQDGGYSREPEEEVVLSPSIQLSVLLDFGD
jgi:hypothetical protein